MGKTKTKTKPKKEKKPNEPEPPKESTFKRFAKGFGQGLIGGAIGAGIHPGKINEDSRVNLGIAGTTAAIVGNRINGGGDAGGYGAAIGGTIGTLGSTLLLHGPEGKKFRDSIKKRGGSIVNRGSHYYHNARDVYRWKTYRGPTDVVLRKKQNRQQRERGQHGLTPSEIHDEAVRRQRILRQHGRF